MSISADALTCRENKRGVIFTAFPQRNADSMTSDGETKITIDMEVEEKSMGIYHIGQVVPFTYSDLLWPDLFIELPGITLALCRTLPGHVRRIWRSLGTVQSVEISRGPIM